MKNLNQEQILTNVIADIRQRISDWICSGGSPEDDYIKRQNKYLDDVVRMINQRC